MCALEEHVLLLLGGVFSLVGAFGDSAFQVLCFLLDLLKLGIEICYCFLIYLGALMLYAYVFIIIPSFW